MGYVAVVLVDVVAMWRVVYAMFGVREYAHDEHSGSAVRLRVVHIVAPYLVRIILPSRVSECSI